MNINHWIVPGIFHWRWSPLCCGIKSTHHTQVALCCSPKAAGRWNLISSLMAKNKKWGFYGLLWTEAQWQVPLLRGRDFSACSTSAPALGCIYSLMGNGSLGMQGTGRAGLRDEAKTGRLSRRLTLYTTHSAGLSSSFFPSGDGGYICRDTGIVEVCASSGPGRRGPCWPHPFYRLQRPSSRVSQLKTWVSGNYAAIPPPPSCAKQNFNVCPTSLSNTHTKKKKIIIIYKRSYFQTNREAFNADIYFPSPPFKCYLFKCRFSSFQCGAWKKCLSI